MGVVYTAWGNVVYYPGRVDTKELESALSKMQEMLIEATPDSAPSELRAIVELLEEMRPQQKSYIQLMRTHLGELLPKPPTGDADNPTEPGDDKSTNRNGTKHILRSVV